MSSQRQFVRSASAQSATTSASMMCATSTLTSLTAWFIANKWYASRSNSARRSKVGPLPSTNQGLSANGADAAHSRSSSMSRYACTSDAAVHDVVDAEDSDATSIGVEHRHRTDL